MNKSILQKSNLFYLNCVNGKKNLKILSFFYKNYKEYNNMEDTSEICPICYEEIKKYGFCVTNCSHVFCMDCMVESMKQKSVLSIVPRKSGS